MTPTVAINTPAQTVDGGASVQLAATASDRDGSIASYAWAAYPDVGAFDDAAVEDPTWTAPAAGAAKQAVTLTLTVTDDRGGTAKARVVITVRARAANQDPAVAIDTPAQTVDGATAVRLAATASDRDGSIASYAWAAYPDVGAFDDAAVEDPTWTAPAAGAAKQAVTLMLTVTDDRGGTAKARVVITVRARAANQDPAVAIDTPAQTVDGATAVRLAATASDRDGSIASYAWAAYPDVGAFDDAAVEDPTWTAPAAGAAKQAVTLTLTVTDDRGGTAKARVVITVRARAANQDPAVAIDTPAQTVDGATAVRLAATAADRDGSIASYAWAAYPDVGAFDDAAAEDPTWTAPAAGAAKQAVTLTLTVTDDRGGTAKARVVITVRARAANQDPAVAIDTPAQTVDGATAVRLAATAADRDGSIASYAWAAYPDVGAFDDAAAEDPTWTAPAAGAAKQAVTLTLTVTDDRGGTAKARVVITVRARAANQDPAVAIDTPAQTVDGGAAVRLAATASDPDGSIASYAWVADPDVGAFDDAAAADPTWTAPAAGSAEQAVTLTATVADDRGGTASASVGVTVRADEIPAGAWVRTVEGDVLDALCWRHYGRGDAVPAVLDANPGLAALGPELPAGRILALPDLPAPERRAAAVRLWEETPR